MQRLTAKLDLLIQLLTGQKPPEPPGPSPTATLASSEMKPVKPRMTNIREEDSEERSGSESFQSSSSSGSGSPQSIASPAVTEERTKPETQLIIVENPEEGNGLEENKENGGEYSGLQKKSLREELALSKPECQAHETPSQIEGIVFMSPIYLSQTKID